MGRGNGLEAYLCKGENERRETIVRARGGIETGCIEAREREMDKKRMSSLVESRQRASNKKKGNEKQVTV